MRSRQGKSERLTRQGKSERLTRQGNTKPGTFKALEGIDMKVALYARVSTDDKNQEPETQLLQLRRSLQGVGCG
jgi:predicted site-specific integrase-resolvase